MHDLTAFQQDYNWRCAFNEAFGYSFRDNYGDELPDPPNPIDQVTEILAASEGENDERDWIALVRFEDNRLAKVFAGCDYTGWD